MEFRALRADEIECRIGTAKEGKGVSLLLYKDARCDQNILDETVGVMNWKKQYAVIDGQLFCTIEIWDDEKKQWIGKQDVGVESNTEAEKGRASDAQKRAAFAFGIGRELYTAPFIWIPGATKYDKFWVSKMEVKDHKITDLTISRKDEYGNKLDAVVFSYPRKARKEPVKEPPKEETKPEPKEGYHATQEQVAIIKARYINANRTKLLDKYGIPDVEHLPRKVADEICAKLKALDEKKEATA